MKKSGFVLLAFLTVTTWTAAAQEARSILEKTAARYETAREYHFQGNVSVRMLSDNREQNVDVALVLAERKPNMIRAQVEGSGVEMLVVSDGTSTWLYVPSVNQYMKQEGPFDPSSTGSPLPNLLQEYAGINDAVETAEVLGEEDVEVNGSSRAAYVLGVTYTDRATIPGPDSTRKTLWIDKENHLILKDETRSKLENAPTGGPLTLEEATRFDVVSVGEPVADSLFAFAPPDGATEMQPRREADGPGGGLVGAPAEDFRLRTLDGAEVTLESLRGKAVLVNLWATWCGPCREEMPVIEKLHRELSGKGLVVLAVDVGETAEEVQAYIEDHGYTFQVLLDEEGAVASQFNAAGIPTTVIIDQQGNVAHHFVGARSERMFREALKDVGVE